MEERALLKKDDVKQAPNLLSRVATAFNVKENFRSLYVRPKGTYEMLDGFRVMGFIAVLCGHTFTQYMYDSLGRPNADPDKTLIGKYHQVANNPNALTVYLHQAYYAVEIFFVISGFLMATILAKEYLRSTNERWYMKIDVIRFLLRRWYRLLPAVLFCLAAFSLHWSLMPEGSTDHNGMRHCKTRFWENILMVNNRVETCLGWTWTVAIEFQFYILSPFIVLLSMKNFRFGMLLVAALALYSIIAVYFEHEKLLDNMQAYHWEVFVQFYFVAYARWNPYLFGLVAGIVFIKREIALKAQLSDEKAEPKPDSTLSTVLRIVGYVLSFAAVLGYSWFRQYRDDIPWRLTAYITLGNTIYGAGLSFIVYHLAIGNLRLLNYILSANWIYPLSMLSYCGYLLHPLFRDALPLLNFSYLGIGFHIYPIVFIFNLIIVIPLALIGYLLVEKPAVNIRPI